MDHAPAPSWLDRHLDNRPGWADAPADGVEIDPTALVGEAPVDEQAAPAGDSWLGDATISALADDVDQIEITDADLATADSVDDEFAVPTGLDTISEPSLVDPFDEFVAETEALTEAVPDAIATTDDAPDADEIAADVDVDDIAPAPADDTTATTTTSDSDDSDGSGPADTGDDSYDAFDVADDEPAGDAVADGIGTNDASWAPGPPDDDAADTGYDAFDDLDEGTDG